MPDHPPVQPPKPEADAGSSNPVFGIDTVIDAAPVRADGPAAGEGAYDPRTLAELEEVFGRPRLLDLLGRLKVEIAQRLHAPAGERTALGHDAHTLLSVSGSLGFFDLSQRCTEMEQAYLRGADLAVPLEAARRAATRAIAAIALIEEGA